MSSAGLPLSGVAVRVISGGQLLAAIVTDSDGEFQCRVSGDFYLRVSKPGFITAERRCDAFRSVPESLTLVRAAVIEGQIRDFAGNPVEGVQAIAEMEGPAEQLSGRKAVKSSETDDRGMFRLAGLPPGVFVVGVVVRRPTATAKYTADAVRLKPHRQSIYYPGVTVESAAERIRLGEGDVRNDIDFAVPIDEVGGLSVSIVAGRPSRNRPDDKLFQESGEIRGQVIDDTGRPISNATVRLFRKSDVIPTRAVVASDRGAFVFDNVPVGTFRVASTRVGYAALDETKAVLAGVPQLGAGPIVSVETDSVSSVKIALARLGSVSGYVTDELGDPMEGATVQALRETYDRGRHWLVPAGSARMSDDRGFYRLSGLRPGTYFIGAPIGASPNTALVGYGATFFPGVSIAAAARAITVAPSEATTGIDFTLIRAATANVSGRIVDATGSAAFHGRVVMLPRQTSQLVVRSPIGAQLLDGGRFEFSSVMPGAYVIQAYQGRSNASSEGEFGALLVDVSGRDISGLTLRTSVGSSISGRIRFEPVSGDAKRPLPTDVRLSALPSNPDVSPEEYAVANISDDWSFHLSGINGSRRLELLGSHSGWVLKEVRVNGRTVTDQPIGFGRTNESVNDVEVIVTDQMSGIEGSAMGNSGQPIRGSHVIVFASQRDKWYPSSSFVRISDVEPDGSFHIDGLREGSYYVALVIRLPSESGDAWQDPVFLDAISKRARLLVLAPGETSVLSLRMEGRPQ